MAQAPTGNVAAAGGATDGDEFDDTIFQEVRLKPNCAQIITFLDTHWSQYEAEKMQFWQLFVKMEEQRAFGAKENECPFLTFSNALSQLRPRCSLIAQFLTQYPDKTSVKNRAKALGFKLRYYISPTEACLLLTGNTVRDMCAAPRSPARMALAEVRRQHQELVDARQAELDKKTTLENKLNAAKGKNDTENVEKFKRLLAKHTKQLDKTEMKFRHSKDELEKEIKAKIADCKAEQKSLTPAARWMKELCEQNNKPFALP